MDEIEKRSSEPAKGVTDPRGEGSLIASMLSEVSSMPKEKIDEILASLPEEKRQKMIASLGSVRAMSRADIEAAIRNDRERSFGLAPWRRWVARLIIAFTEAILRKPGSGSRS